MIDCPPVTVTDDCHVIDVRWLMYIFNQIKMETEMLALYLDVFPIPYKPSECARPSAGAIITCTAMCTKRELGHSRGSSSL